MKNQPSLLDPLELVTNGTLILVDTSAFLEVDRNYVGGLWSLIEKCGTKILEMGAPLIVLKAVEREINVKAKNGNPQNPGVKEQAELALKFISDMEKGNLISTQFGAATDTYADDEFDTVVKMAAERNVPVCLVTNDKTRKINTYVLGARHGVPQIAGRLLANGSIEVEDPTSLRNWGKWKMSQLENSNFSAKYDRNKHDELATLLPELERLFEIPVWVPEPINKKSSATAARKPDHAKKNQATGKPFSQNAKIKTGDFELPVVQIPGSGDEFWAVNPSGTERLELGERIGGGKEGQVFKISNDITRVVKIFNQRSRTQHRFEKVQLLVERELWESGICFPSAIAQDAQGAFLGYVMRTAVGGKNLRETITNRVAFKNSYPDWRKEHLVEVCLSFLKRVQAMHNLNILIGDVNEANLMVSPNKDVWIIDTDSCQFEGYVCPVGWPEFTAPELTNYEKLRTLNNELFSVAMVLFMIMMTGRFAYDRADVPSTGHDDLTAYLIKEAKFPYTLTENRVRRGDGDEPFGDAKYMWSHLDYRVKKLFWHTFHHDGSRYKNRPSVEEWISVFKSYKSSLENTDKWQDPMSHDVYPIRHKAFNPEITILDCPKCGRENGISGWKNDGDDEKIPAICNVCAPKCEACGDPDQYGTRVDGLCKACRAWEPNNPDTAKKTSTPDVKARKSVKKVQPEKTAKTTQGRTKVTPKSSTQNTSSGWSKMKKLFTR